jgi:hypothetical protein
MPELEGLRRSAVVCKLIEQLRGADSWDGETHVQKATFLLEEGREVPLAFGFTLYKYGPFSFDLREELNGLRGLGFVGLEPQPYPYGPRLRVTNRGRMLMDRHPRTLGSFRQPIADVVEFVGAQGVATLERLSTAVYLLRRDPQASDARLMQELRDVKPHISEPNAQDAVTRTREFLRAA